MKRIENLEELAEALGRAAHVKLYGAGLKLASFMEMITELKMPLRAECVLVSSARGNPSMVFGIPVEEVSEAVFHDMDVILLTMSERFVADAEENLARRGVTRNIYSIDYAMVDAVPYQKVFESVKPFVQSRLWLSGDRNLPVKTDENYVWSCWWQGEENAPELVKKCWESQRKRIPEGTKHVIITWDNYRNYVELPEYVVEKAKRGSLLPAHLADIVRCILLYKYGGIWLDATVYMTDRLPEACFSYEILTRSTGERIYCTDVSWVTWFLGGRKGQELYRFLMEAFFYYLKEYDKILHYYMIDFLIAIACNEIEGIRETFQKISVNNQNAAELQKYLAEAYDRELYRTCTEGGFLQKLTYKGGGYAENSLYRYLMGANMLDADRKRGGT